MQTRSKPKLTPPPIEKKIQTLLQEEESKPYINYKYPELSENQIHMLNQVINDKEEEIILLHLQQLINNESKYNIQNLHLALQQLPKEDSLNFIQRTIKQMAKISIDHRTILPQNIPLLISVNQLQNKQEERVLKFSRLQAFCFISLSFFNLLQTQKSSPHFLPSPSTFLFLVHKYPNDLKSAQKVEKLKCFISYFNQVSVFSSLKNQQIITFKRLKLNAIVWSDSKQKIGMIQINRKGKIEDCEDALLVDFAHSLIGGGTLTNGCVQEEIMFLTHPECLLSVFFTSKIQKDEAILMQNMIQYNEYTGYAMNFKYLKPCTKVRPHNIVAIDAKEFTQDGSEQYKQENILRELNKAMVGFSLGVMELNEKKISSGNWGCGAFKGDPQLKFLIQILAFSQVNMDGILIYNSFEEKLGDELENIYLKILKKFKTVGDLSKWILSGIDQSYIQKL